MTCFGKTAVKTRGYQDVFYSLDGKTFPGFHELLHRIKLPTNGDTKQLSEETEKTVAAQLAPIYHVCRDCHFRPLLSEFALISDTRGVGPDVDPFFASYISIFLQPAMDLANAYADALRYMGTSEAGKVQIVPHPEFFECKMAAIQASCASYVKSASQTDIPVSERPVCLVGLRQRFELIQDPGARLASRVEVFLEAFFKNLRSYPSLAGVTEKLARSEFLLLPFVRQGHDSSALPHHGAIGREQFRSYPGGALFLFLELQNHPQNNDQLQQNLDEVARALSWLMAESSIRESYALLQAEDQRKRNSISYSVTHPLKHRLTALDTNMELLMNSYFERLPDFESRLKRHYHRVQSVHWFAELAHMLHFAAMNPSIQPLSAREHDGGLRFGAIGVFDIKQALVEEATNALIELTGLEDLHPVIEGFESIEGVPGRVRLQDLLYREIVYELIANIRRHGVKHNEVTHANVAIGDVEGMLALVLTNNVDERLALIGLGKPVNDWARWNSASPRGLSFVKIALGSTYAGELYYKHPLDARKQERIFSVALALKGLHNQSVLGKQKAP